MKKTLFVYLMAIISLGVEAQNRIYVNKDNRTTHAYNSERVEKISFPTTHSAQVTLKNGDVHNFANPTIDNITFSVPEFYQEGAPTTVNESLSSSMGSMKVSTVKGDGWILDTRYKCAKGTGYVDQTTTHESESYLLTPELDLTLADSVRLSFDYILRYVKEGAINRVLITDNYTGNPTTTEWTVLTDQLTEGRDWKTWQNYSEALPSRFVGESNVVIAFEFACGTSSATWEVRNVNVKIIQQTAPINPEDIDQDNKNRNIDMVNAPESWRLEYPHTRGGDMNIVIVKRTAQYGITFSLEWDCSLKANRWTCYEFYDNNYQGNAGRNDSFRPDPDIPEQYQTTLSDYSGSGYSRGHLCPSGDRQCSVDQNKQTFFLSNMQPQIQEHNGGVWAQLENKVRAKASNFDTLYVVKAATIEDFGTWQGVMTHTDSGLIVPKYFYMALLGYTKSTNTYNAIGIWSPHSGGSTTEYISIAELQNRTGIDFFCNLPDVIEAAVESEANRSYWGF
jgi:endonuclease G